jgi:hypothetical protein
MKKRVLLFNYIILVVIISLLIYLIVKNNQLRTDMVNLGNYISEKLDILNSRIMMDVAP